MFGFAEADIAALTPEQLQRYRGAYCGLCRTLHRRFGSLGRLTLTYDMTFLVLLLGSMYEPEEQRGSGRCLPHPVHARGWWASRFTDYAADMNAALAYFNCRDDWNDDRNPLSLAEAAALKAAYRAASQRWPVQCRAMEECMAAIRAVEEANDPNPDAAAACFGRLMGILFTPERDSLWSDRLRAFGEALGRFIYMMDACVDSEKDRRRGSYNPLLAMPGDGMTEQEQRMMLKMLIGRCTAEFERLPLVQDVEILRSVLYSGVWKQYAARKKKEQGGAEDERRPV